MNDMLTAQRQAQEIAQRHAMGDVRPTLVSPTEPVLGQVYKRLSGLRERLSDAFLRVSASLDRAAGAMPPSAAENGNTSSNGLLDDIGIRLNEIDDLIDALAAQADRLERIA